MDARVNFYDLAGLTTAQAGRMASLHVGDDLQWGGFQEGANPPTALSARAGHPAYGNATMIVGFGALLLAILYMDKRIKVPLLP